MTLHDFRAIHGLTWGAVGHLVHRTVHWVQAIAKRQTTPPLIAHRLASVTPEEIEEARRLYPDRRGRPKLQR